MNNTDEIDHAKSSTFHENDVAPSTGDSNASKPSNIDSSSAEHDTDKVIVDPAISSKPKGWVQFEDEDDNKTAKEDKIPQMENVDLSDKPQEKPAAVLTTESVHVNISNKTINHPLSQNSPAAPSPAVIDIPNTSNTNPGLRTIELSTGRVREGFANGDIIVTLLPVNTRWPWITPAQFRPELVPEELMAQGLTLTVEEYVHALETLVNDFRFTVYNVCYKRVLCVWIFFAFSVLLGLLFSGLKGIALFSLGVGWLFLNAAAIFLCMWVKLRLARGLERCLASVNKQLLRHKIILVLDDRGKISCHKVNLCFMYFDPSQCVTYLNEFIERSEQSGTSIEPGWESRLDVSATDIVIQGSNPTRVSRKQVSSVVAV
ncbi:transmembrane protein 268 isoform X5 [Bradysia coprophila]|uniref:transmembrane protein 268 isoform X5 n=1 Tax=Bradysia coprophila TaxID=38358 RepID=UPI00187D90BB|nr:transmembrane protein 268 isoform X5 [Bradysia coprophila]